MSAIFGLWRLDSRSVSPAVCEEMSRLLEHRGPDGCGVWSDGPVSLGHRILRTTPEAEGEIQPTATTDGDLVLTADARIDNREELIKALGLRCSDRGAITDADLILDSYRRWGERCVEQWVGDFAVVIWDSGRRHLFCARDPFGVKALYYHHTRGRLFAFASEIAALLSLEDVPDEIDEIEVARHLLIPIGSDGSTTYHRHISKLMPAHVLVVSDRDLEMHRYWHLDGLKELHLSSDGEYVEALRETFGEAVRCRLRSAGPVASMLSGGIDSSAVTCVAADLIESAPEASPLHGLSAVYPGVPESDERGFIDAVLEGHRIVPHFFAADTVSPIAEIDRMNRLVGGAIWGQNLYLNWVLYGMAAQAGARVVLDGFDGDTTISHGTDYLSELAMAGRWLKLARTLVPYSRRRDRPVLSDYIGLVRFGLRHRFRDTVVGTLVRRLLKGKNEGKQMEPGTAGQHLTVNPDFVRRFTDRIASVPDPPTTERESHLRRLNSLILFEEIGWLEACAAGRGVEVRLPFCDVRLVELCFSFPPDQKIRGGWTRYAMREAMEGVLPAQIQWRPGKTNLNPGWASAWRSSRNDRIEEMLAHPSPAMKRYLEPTRIQELYDRYLKREATRGENRALWRALSLGLWLSSRNV